MGKGFRLRDATAGDQLFLLDMLVEAANWTGDRQLDRETVRGRPDLFHYLADWPADGEIGQIAGADDHPIGACWLRYFTSEDPGYGYVSDDIPELSLAVTAAWRGQGVGRLLLRKTADRAARVGIARISLSVERANRAHHLYESEGYQVVERGPYADTMLVVL
jgi:GNAT superfamily N-acetyltransferase